MLRFLTAGESHGPSLTAILEGMPAGVPVMLADIDRDLARRQVAYGAGGRMKIEKDAVSLTAGVVAQQTTGAPIALEIANLDYRSWQTKQIAPFTVPRPGHADLTGAVKYGYRDLRLALERASARETAARVAVGALCKCLLAEFGIIIGSYVTMIGGVTVGSLEHLPYPERFAIAESNDVRCPDPETVEPWHARIWETMQARDTVGGIFEVVALGVPPGLGTHVHWDRRLSARLVSALASIHAIKGVEIGDAFANAARFGTEVHDEIFLASDGSGEIVRHSNRAGGFEGGITTGQPVVMRAAMKPISTTLNPRRSVDLASGEETVTVYERSDFSAVPRAAVVGEAMVAFVLADALCEKLGGDSLAEMRPRFATLRQSRLEDLPMDHTSWQFGYQLHE